MKKYFEVTFEHSEGVFCSNIAHAETFEAIQKYYSKYKWFHEKHADEYAVKEAIDRGMPIIEV